MCKNQQCTRRDTYFTVADGEGGGLIEISFYGEETKSLPDKTNIGEDVWMAQPRKAGQLLLETRQLATHFHLGTAVRKLYPSI